MFGISFRILGYGFNYSIRSSINRTGFYRSRKKNKINKKKDMIKKFKKKSIKFVYKNLQKKRQRIKIWKRKKFIDFCLKKIKFIENLNY